MAAEHLDALRAKTIPELEHMKGWSAYRKAGWRNDNLRMVIAEKELARQDAGDTLMSRLVDAAELAAFNAKQSTTRAWVAAAIAAGSAIAAIASAALGWTKWFAGG